MACLVRMSLVVCVFVFPFMASAQMTEPQAPYCWQESGMAIADGQFSIHISTEQASSAELLLALRLVQGNTIEPMGFPFASVETNTLIIQVQTKWPDNALDGSRPAMIGAVSRELSQLRTQITAAEITCVPLSFPAR